MVGWLTCHQDYASAFPAGLSAAASWDKSMMYQRGVQMGSEFKAKGAHVILGPVSGPLGRVALGGRNWEGFSPDPYLTGVGMKETITGLQSVGLQACAKHFILNEQESQRNPSFPNGTMQYSDPPEATIKSVSENADDRTTHELYLWPFADAVKAGVASVMCSYNRINGTYGCQNSKTLNGLLKDELGFQGYVMSDWGTNNSPALERECIEYLLIARISADSLYLGGTHSTIESINAGLDMEMPGDSPNVTFAITNYWNGTIQQFFANETLTSTRLNDMLLRILTPYFHLGQDQGYPSVDPSSADLNTLYPQQYRYDFGLNGTRSRDVRDNHAELIRTLGAQSSVLLKNVNGALPLKAPKNIGVFGNDAADTVNGQYFFQDEDIGTLPIGGGSGKSVSRRNYSHATLAY
jgi:beta-glucosidase